ncbi:hypothetical protein EDC01DRAFT_634011 [Geopyxis carbonaria]|nr:hypothetical protein EDC01DRAFT_634011 [Geopyxis carbonaria]
MADTASPTAPSDLQTPQTPQTPQAPYRRPRPLLVKRLQQQLPSINLTSVIFRIAQVILLFGFTLGYITSGPQVYLDIFVWQKGARIPFEVTVYRDFAPWWEGYNETYPASATVPHYKFYWNDTRPFPGVTEPYTCKHEERFGCNGTQWVGTRLGWLDSWPETSIPTVPPWILDSVYIDRYIFWLIMAGGFLSMGHNIIVLTHAIEPRIFPMAIEDHIMETPLELYELSSKYDYVPRIWFIKGLQAYQKWAFFMGWAMWGLYITTFVLNAVLLAGLTKYRSLPEVYAIHRYPTEVLTDGAADVETGTSSGFQHRSNRQNSTYSRASGRDIVRIIAVV